MDGLLPQFFTASIARFVKNWGLVHSRFALAFMTTSGYHRVRCNL